MKNPAYSVVVRCGCEGGGKGALVYEELCHTVTTTVNLTYIFQPIENTDKEQMENEYIIRKLTPLECERLQGFPDGWTDIKVKCSRSKKDPRGYVATPVDETPDSPRYKALGNSMAVPVMAWIGQRIQQAIDRWESE